MSDDQLISLQAKMTKGLWLSQLILNIFESQIESKYCLMSFVSKLFACKFALMGISFRQ